MRLVLARHGQTQANVDGVLDTLPPGRPLTEEGHRQAAALAEELAAEPVVAVFASSARRAQQTAAPVAERHGLAVQLLDGVHETFVGELEDRGGPEVLRDFHTVFRAWHDGDLDRRVPGGESGREVLDRYLPDVERVSAAHRDGTVVLVSHGAALRLAAAALAGVDGAFADANYLPNTGTIVLERDGSAWRCVSWGGNPPPP